MCVHLRRCVCVHVRDILCRCVCMELWMGVNISSSTLHSDLKHAQTQAAEYQERIAAYATVETELAEHRARQKVRTRTM